MSSMPASVRAVTTAPAIRMPAPMAVRPRAAGTPSAQTAKLPVHAPVKGRGMATRSTIAEKPWRRMDLAVRCVYSGAQIAFIYMAIAAALFVFVPDIFLRPFAAQADGQSFADIRPIAIVALRFVAVFSLFDTLSIVFSSALKGAGDTRYVMFMVLFLSSVGLVLPSYVALVILGTDILIGWSILTVYIIVLGFAFYFRFLGGKWKSMRVIEPDDSNSTAARLRA